MGQITFMEVHHPHHIVHKKKWNEYILEFIMLFVAVSLGFFAENLREQQIEKHREISYLENVHEDLQLDFQTTDTVIQSNNVRLAALDTFFVRLNSTTVTNEDVYYYVRNLALRSTFESSHIGFDQIKSAGGLRMIKNKEITSGIQQYEKMLSSIEKLEELRDRTLEQARFKMARVFDAKVLYEMSIHQSEAIIRFPKPTAADNILKKDPAALNELINLVSTGLNTNRYITSRLKALLKIGNQLDNAIMKEYGDKMH
ncbi:MAG: hypothetical protein RL634_920 [Bacteroidota bacterium]